MPTNLDPDDPKWKKENRDPKDRGPAPLPKEDRDDKADTSKEDVARPTEKTD